MNKNLAVFTFCLIIAAILISYVTVQYAKPSFLFLIVTVLAAATFLVYFFIQRTSPENFIKNYLLTIVTKLLAGGLFVGAIIFADIEGAEQNAVSFMITYLVFTGLEVGFLFGKFYKS